MQPKKSDRQRSFLCPDLIDQLDPRHHLLGLAKAIPWQIFEDSFRPLYQRVDLFMINTAR